MLFTHMTSAYLASNTCTCTANSTNTACPVDEQAPYVHYHACKHVFKLMELPRTTAEGAHPRRITIHIAHAVRELNQVVRGHVTGLCLFKNNEPMTVTRATQRTAQCT